MLSNPQRVSLRRQRAAFSPFTDQHHLPFCLRVLLVELGQRLQRMVVGLARDKRPNAAEHKGVVIDVQTLAHGASVR